MSKLSRTLTVKMREPGRHMPYIPALGIKADISSSQDCITSSRVDWAT